MIQFVKIPRNLRELTGKTRYVDLAIYAEIRSRENHTIAKYGYDKLAKKLHISEQTIKESLVRLESAGFIEITQENTNKYKRLDKNTGEIIDGVYNIYKFIDLKEYGFVAIKAELLNSGFKGKELGILIYLELISDFGIILYKNQNELATKLGFTTKTLRKYLNSFTDYLQPIKNGIKTVNIRQIFEDEIQWEKSVVIPDIYI